MTRQELKFMTPFLLIAAITIAVFLLLPYCLGATESVSRSDPGLVVSTLKPIPAPVEDLIESEGTIEVRSASEHGMRVAKARIPTTSSLADRYSVSGSVSDIVQRTTSAGIPLTIRLAQITYEGRVEKVQAEHGKDGSLSRVVVQIGDASFRIGNTQIQGGVLASATAGPMKIDLATRRDLVIEYLVEPSADGIRIVEAKFNLEPNNWRVRRPETVRTTGLLATEARVIEGLRAGLRENADSIQQIVRDEAASFLEPIETKLLTMSPVPSADMNQIASTSSVSKASETEIPAMSNQGVRPVSFEKTVIADGVTSELATATVCNQTQGIVLGAVVRDTLRPVIARVLRGF